MGRERIEVSLDNPCCSRPRRSTRTRTIAGSCLVMNVEPLALIEYWAVDPDYDGQVFRLGVAGLPRQPRGNGDALQVIDRATGSRAAQGGRERRICDTRGGRVRLRSRSGEGGGRSVTSSPTTRQACQVVNPTCRINSAPDWPPAPPDLPRTGHADHRRTAALVVRRRRADPPVQFPSRPAAGDPQHHRGA